MVRYAALNRSVFSGARWLAVLTAASWLFAAGPAASQMATQQASGWRSGAPAVQYSVRNGDSLDRIIAQHFGGAPFTVPFLREVLARMNPQALPQGARGVLLAGTVMQIPDSCQLQQMAFGDSGQCGLAGGSGGGQPGVSPQERAEIERRSWVRYP